jgi:hypothetical protein
MLARKDEHGSFRFDDDDPFEADSSDEPMMRRCVRISAGLE